ncbi:patatin-like phospholipase family protein [Ralstonia sp. SET104]|uniref:patatin-like phospholipase family protein n=1 Tax=Ralstonia sp. SET104 TaxID=2448774 RepID=UPI0035B555D6
MNVSASTSGGGTNPREDLALPGQVVLVLQGGGALGSYQAGVYQALHEAGIEPDWVIGTSIGAINGAIIAGNPPAERLDRLHRFWDSVTCGVSSPLASTSAAAESALCKLSAVLNGLPGFFRPQPRAWLSPQLQLGPDAAAYYSTAPLRESLATLVDFDYLRERHVRLTVGTVNVRTGNQHYFTNRDTTLTLEHVMASAALPPAFPAVRINGESYWDGGIHSNTPLEAVLDDNPRRSSVIFAVQLWSPQGTEPETIWEVIGRQKDIQYASKAETQLARQRQIHRLRHVIRELAQYIAPAEIDSPAVKALLQWGCGTTIQVIQLQAPHLDNDDHAKDIDFSAAQLLARWEAGYRATRRTIELAPWRDKLDPVEGIGVHAVTMSPA